MSVVMDTLQQLQAVNLDQFNLFLDYWLAFALLSGLLILVGDHQPISNRIENSTIRKLGGSINKRAGWIIMEIPILIVVLYFFLTGSHGWNASAVMVAFFVMHYINRALIFPYRIKVNGKTMPVISMLSSMIFYIVNGYLIGHYFGSLKSYPVEWLWDPRFLIGAAMFIVGFVINIQSDNILINLRKPGETGYKIPRGKWFRWVSCPNYMGECLEWIGFAIMSWSFLGAVYAVWVCLPLVLQARNAHQWYRDTFAEEYPAKRRAIVPFIL
ncbi:Uncharacterised protein [BD1-7 clade bacterium]|uniref:3-oxo-5-alpha-steroid 4-dehydrogenase C-terminal domain-containing protein n=1 Tax=BD1-7 clade bacterium TaxID=2029982 RepID=A0A5S9NN87_9GAMM|nr:Uncharacterised protein [BD1-7 clade bacterium]